MLNCCVEDANNIFYETYFVRSPILSKHVLLVYFQNTANL